MSSVRHLQQRYKERQQEYDQLTELIRRLRTHYAIQADIVAAFRVELEIKEYETRRDDVDKEIQTLERSLKSEPIYGELFRLNYVQQVQLFREFIQEKRIGAFLVHGSPEHGQIFLLKRLLQVIPDSTVTKVIKFGLSSKVLKKDIAALWRQLAEQMELSKFSSSEEIAKRVVAQLQTQHVILIFHELEHMYEDYLQKLLHNFWLLLVNSAQRANYQTNEFFLLMFLVDDEGCVNTWNIQYADQLDPVWEPCIPIRLPIIDRLSDRVLANWMENAINVLPTNVTKEIDDTVKVILEKSGGVPERVFAEIFSLCHCNWEHEEVRWLKL